MAGHESSIIYITAFVMSVMIFISGIAIGILMLQLRNRKLEQEMKEINIKSLDMGMQLRLMENADDCVTFDALLNSTLNDMGKIESKFAEIEDGSELNKYDMNYMRKNYQLLSLKYLLLIEKFPQCIKNRTIIIYFYTNKDCQKCEDQGIILTHVKKIYRNKVLIFPFDDSLNLSSIRMLELEYNITSYPSIVVDGKVHGYMNLDSLEALLNEET